MNEKGALVTNTSRGVGAEIAREITEYGTDVVINYRSKERRAEAVRAAGRRALAAQAGLVDEVAATAMFSQLRETFGALDLLILYASGGLEKDVPGDDAMRLNRPARLDMLAQALPLMPAGCRSSS